MSQSSFVCTQSNGFKSRKWLNISIWLIDGTLTGTTTLGQSGPGNNGNKGVLHILQSSRTEVSPLGGLVSYQGCSLDGGYPAAEMQSVYSTAPANLASYIWICSPSLKIFKKYNLISLTLTLESCKVIH